MERKVPKYEYHKIRERKVKTLTRNWRDHCRTGTQKLYRNILIQFPCVFICQSYSTILIDSTMFDLFILIDSTMFEILQFINIESLSILISYYQLSFHRKSAKWIYFALTFGLWLHGEHVLKYLEVIMSELFWKTISNSTFWGSFNFYIMLAVV